MKNLREILKVVDNIDPLATATEHKIDDFD